MWDTTFTDFAEMNVWIESAVLLTILFNHIYMTSAIIVFVQNNQALKKLTFT